MIENVNRHTNLKIVFMLLGISVLMLGCVQNTTLEKASNREIAVKKIKSARAEYNNQLPIIQQNCEGAGSEVARVSCEAPIALKVAREAGLPASDIEYIAEGTDIELQLAHKVDNGQLSQAEAEAQLQIELVRLQSHFQQRSASNNLKKLQALSSLRSSLPSRAPTPIISVPSTPTLIAPPRPPVYTNCSTSLGSINCTSY